MEIGRIFRTVQYLKPVQVIYQLKNRMMRVKALSHYGAGKQGIATPLILITLPGTRHLVKGDNAFTFLNASKEFSEGIDWTFEGYGKLWNYNLQYLDYIHQEEIPENKRVVWVRDLYRSLDTGTLKLEPYPVSLRTMNIIRFFSQDPSRLNTYKDILPSLYAELSYLHSHYEYHLLGNHLLENAFAMLMGGHFFGQKEWQLRATQILREQLTEQTLKDGAHFELSPMYHQIILFRVLEAFSYLPKNGLSEFLKHKASEMLGWLNGISLSNGDIPHFNDSADGIAFTTVQLNQIANRIAIKPNETVLKESGYRRIKEGAFDLVFDVHGVSPSYQPGHNHSDHLSFVLYLRGNPFIVDPGTSTYTIGARRDWERSSAAHNTVTVEDRNQSEVWGGFRVGRRAKAAVLNDDPADVLVELCYSGIMHKRRIAVHDGYLTIRDCVNTIRNTVGRFYFHPQVKITGVSSHIVTFENNVQMNFEGAGKIEIKDYEYCMGFNRLTSAHMLEVSFTGEIKTIILAD